MNPGTGEMKSGITEDESRYTDVNPGTGER
jgi:hypothetical protein